MALDSQAGELGSLHGFAVPLSTFIGRSDEIAELGALVREYHMVTVTGPGGMGKTRLADQVARALAPEFADGAWLAEFAGTAEPSLVLAQVAAVLSGRAPDAEAIAHLVGRRQLLLVLDNCEHVLAPVAQLCAAILSVADDVRILATSREPVGVTGEARYRLRPMSLPAESGTYASAESDAVALFAHRARQAGARFTLSQDNLPDVTRLVRRLDGMPLAIELAAARVEALGLAPLANGLDDRFRLLSGARRTGAERQRSLAATAEWSYRLLSADEREAFRKLAVFPGAFTLDAAREVAGQDVATAIVQLVDCSMIVPPQEGVDGRARYGMLETLRVFGQDKLTEAGEAASAAQALAAFALDVAEQAAPMLRTRADGAAKRWLDAEALCLQKAMAWSLSSDPGTALRLAVALASWWQRRGQYRSGYDTLSQVVELADPGSPGWCAARLWLGVLANAGLATSESLPHFDVVIAAMVASEPTAVLVRALSSKGGALANLGRLDEAEPFVHRALTLATQIDDPLEQANALYWLSGISHYRGDQVASLRWARQLALVDNARVPGRILSRGYLGQVIPLFEAGEYAQARELSELARDVARSSSDPVLEAESLFHLARIELAAGKLAAARRWLKDALIVEQQAGRPIALTDLFDVCGHFFVQVGASAAALTTWAAQAALLRAARVADPVEDARLRDEPQRKARSQLGAAASLAAEERGAAMTLPVATEFTLLTLEADEQQEPAGRPIIGLSAREQELVVLVARGLTDAQIAGELFISLSTVRSHLDRIRDKTGCRRRADLTILGLQGGLA